MMIANFSQLGTAMNALKGVNFTAAGIEEAEALAAATNGITGTNLKFILSSKGVSAETAKESLMMNKLTADEADAELVKLRLISANEVQNAETIKSAMANAVQGTSVKKLAAMNVEEATSALIAANAEGGLTTVKAEAILTSARVTGTVKQEALANLQLAGSSVTAGTAVKGLTASLWSSTKAMVTFLTTNPIGWAILAAGAIYLTVKGLDALSVSTKEASEALDKSAEEYEKISSELNTLNTDLQTTADRIAELQKKSNEGKITLVEKNELEQLKLTNSELERQKIILDANAKTAQDIKNKDAIKLNGTMSKSYSGYDSSGSEGWLESNAKLLWNDWTPFKDFEQMGTEDFIASATKEMSGLSSETERYKQLQAQLNPLAEDYLKIVNNLVPTTDAEEAVLANANLQLDKITLAYGSAEEKATVFQNIINRFASSNKALISIAQSGKLTVEEFKKLQSGGLGAYLYSLGFTAQQASDYLNTLGVKAGEAAPPVDDLTSAAEALKTSLTKLSDVQGVMESIKQEMEDFGAIGMDNINKLLKDFPELTDVVANYLAGVSSANDVYSALQNVYNSDLQASKAAIVEKLKDNVEFYKSLGKTYTTYTDDMGVNQKIDLGNSKTLAQAKLKVETALLNELSFAWSKYYDATSQTYTAYYTNLLNSVSSSYRGDNPALNQALEEAFAVQSALKGASEVYKNLANSADFNNISASFTDAGDKDKTDKWKEAFEIEKAELDHNLAMSLISETQYTNALEQKYKYYFSNKKLYLEQYNQYEEEVYKRRISENIADFDKQKKALDHQKTTGTVSEKKYTDTLEALYKKYFSNKKLYLEQYTQYEEEVYSNRQSILESDKEKIEAIFDATKDMIKQEWEDSKSVLESQKESLDDSVSAQVDALEEVRDREKQALSDSKDAYDAAMDAQIDATEKARDAQIDALNDRKDAMEDAIDAEIEALEKSRDADKEALEAKKDNLADYVDARKKALQEIRDQDTYNDELSDKQKSVSDIQFQLSSMAGDSSDAAIRRRMELQDELNKAQKDVSTYVADHDYDAQIAALDAAQKLEDESIDSQVKTLEKKIDNQIAAFEASKELQTKQLEAQIDAVNSQMDAQIEGLKLAKDAQDKAMEAQEKAIDAKIDAQIKSLENMQKVEDDKIDAQIKVIDDKLANEGLIVNEAYTRMNGMNKKLYADLIEWNNKYGTGIQTDITDQWKSAYDAVRTYSGALSALGATTSITTQINPKGYASGTMSLPYTGVVEHSENGAELILNAARNGGNYAMLNKGSPIFTAEQTANLKSFMARPSDFISKALGNNVSSKMSGTIKASIVTNNSPTAVTINNDFIINGNDPSGIAEEIKKIMPKITDSAVDKINKTIFRNGGRLTANSMA